METATQVKDAHGTVWTLRADGWYWQVNGKCSSGGTLSKISEHYGPLTVIA